MFDKPFKITDPEKIMNARYWLKEAERVQSSRKAFMKKAYKALNEGDKNTDLDDKSIVALARENFNKSAFDQITYEESVPLFPQVTYHTPTQEPLNFVKAVRAATSPESKE